MDTVVYNARSIERATPDALRPLWTDAYRLLMSMPGISAEQIRLQPRIWQMMGKRLTGQK